MFLSSIYGHILYIFCRIYFLKLLITVFEPSNQYTKHARPLRTSRHQSETDSFEFVRSTIVAWNSFRVPRWSKLDRSNAGIFLDRSVTCQTLSL